MIPVSDAQTVRARDHALLHELGMPAHTLMEIAAHGAAQRIHAHLPENATVSVFCGPGNNGGDGWVIARWLSVWGHPVRCWSPIEPRTPESKRNAELGHRIGLQHCQTPHEALNGAHAAVDALLGTGQHSAPRGHILDGVRALCGATVPIFAIDMPTGLCTDTGQPLGRDWVTAAHTVTLGDWKQGLLCSPASEYAGAVHRVDIGLALADDVPDVPSPTAHLLERADVVSLLPKQSDNQAKWNRGHVAIQGGGGASVLAAHAAFRAGAGLVTLLAPRHQWPSLHGLWPEVILAPPESLNPSRHDVLVIGMGLGFDSPESVCALWDSWPNPAVFDADALTILAQRSVSPSTHPRILTPHAAEAARLLHQQRQDVEANRFHAAAILSEMGVCVLKGPNTIVSATNAPNTVVPFRCGQLATAGSGDVLAGLIGGILAQKSSAHHAAMIAAYWHAWAGTQMPHRGTASDLLAALTKQP